MTVGSAAAWYTDPAQATAAARGTSPAPRALEAWGLATMHHILAQLGQVKLRPRFAEACKAFGDIVWCDDLDDLMIRASAREALAVIVDLADRAACRRPPPWLGFGAPGRTSRSCCGAIGSAPTGRRLQP